jgi:hypothetical protein
MGEMNLDKEAELENRRISQSEFTTIIQNKEKNDDKTEWNFE